MMKSSCITIGLPLNVTYNFGMLAVYMHIPCDYNPTPLHEGAAVKVEVDKKARRYIKLETNFERFKKLPFDQIYGAIFAWSKVTLEPFRLEIIAHKIATLKRKEESIILATKIAQNLN